MHELEAEDLLNVRVLFFSLLREKIGQHEIQLALPQRASGADLLDRIVARYEDIAPYRPVIRLAVNEAYVREDVVLRDGDEVALITPVSGG